MGDRGVFASHVASSSDSTEDSVHSFHSACRPWTGSGVYEFEAFHRSGSLVLALIASYIDNRPRSDAFQAFVRETGLLEHGSQESPATN